MNQTSMEGLSEKALEIYKRVTEIFSKYRSGTNDTDDIIDIASDAMKLTYLKIEFVPIMYYFEKTYLLTSAKVKATESMAYVQARQELTAAHASGGVKPTEAYISAKADEVVIPTRQEDAVALADLKSVKYLWEATTDAINILKARLKTNDNIIS